MKSLAKLIELAREQLATTDCTDGHLMASLLAEKIIALFAEDQPCGIPEPELLPGIGKIRFPEDIDGLWDIDDACAFAVMVLKLRDKAS